MKVGDLITSVDSKYSNTYVDQDKVDWINKLEQKLYSDFILLQKEDKMDLVADQAEYTLTGYSFDDILKVEVNGTEYNLSSPSYYTVNTYYRQGKDEKVTLNPAPNADATDGLAIVYRWKPSLKTVLGKATEELELADQYADLYRYHIYAEICALRKEFAEYNNWMILFNTELQDLLIKMGNTAPPDARAKNAKRWGRW